MRVDGNNVRNAGYFQYILHFRNGSDSRHFPSTTGNGFGIYCEEPDTNRSQEINVSQIDHDKWLFTRTIAGEFCLNLAGPSNIQPADQLEYTDAVRRLIELKFHCSHLFHKRFSNYMEVQAN